MNLEDLAKKTIDEINNQLQTKTNDDFIVIENDEIVVQNDEIKDKKLEQNLEDKLEELNKKIEQVPILEDIEENNEENINLQEDIFLKNIRERILVLFEGIKNTPKQDLEFKLDLIINFLEFLLANIEDKLKK